MSVEGLKSFFDIAALVLLFLTAVAGTGVLLTGNIINKRQSNQLRAFDTDITKAKSELATQQERAAKAESSIALAEQHSSEANAKAEGFRLDIAKSNEGAAQAKAQVAGASAEAAKAIERTEEAVKAQKQLQIDLAKQQERAATAENELVRLKESLKDRTISPAQEKVLIAALTGAPSGHVEVWWTASDTDSFGLATQMVEIFKKSGWADVSERFASGGTGNGFFIAVHNHLNAPAFAVSVQKAYKLIGIDLNGFSRPDTPEGVVQIFIGHKVPAQ